VGDRLFTPLNLYGFMPGRMGMPSFNAEEFVRPGGLSERVGQQRKEQERSQSARQLQMPNTLRIPVTPPEQWDVEKLITEVIPKLQKTSGEIIAFGKRSGETIVAVPDAQVFAQALVDNADIAGEKFQAMTEDMITVLTGVATGSVGFQWSQEAIKSLRDAITLMSKIEQSVLQKKKEISKI